MPGEERQDRPFLNIIQQPISGFQYDLHELFFQGIKARKAIIRDQSMKRKIHPEDRAELLSTIDSLLVVLKPNLKLQAVTDFPILNKLAESMKGVTDSDLLEAIKEFSTLLNKIGVLDIRPDTSIKG